MSTFFNSQIGIFLIYLIAGVLICLLYDIFRALRKTVKTPDLVTYIEDTIFLDFSSNIFNLFNICIKFGRNTLFHVYSNLSRRNCILFYFEQIF